MHLGVKDNTHVKIGSREYMFISISKYIYIYVLVVSDYLASHSTTEL